MLALSDCTEQLELDVDIGDTYGRVGRTWTTFLLDFEQWAIGVFTCR